MKALIAIALVTTAVLSASAQRVQQETPAHAEKIPEGVWTWSEQRHGDHKLGVTVRLSTEVLYNGVLPICRGSRDAENGQAKFHFAGGHLFQGRYHTNSADSIEGNIWQAGGESDALILGISFDTKNQILLNTLHIAKPDMQTSSELDKNIFITTYPVPAR